MIENFRAPDDPGSEDKPDIDGAEIPARVDHKQPLADNFGTVDQATQDLDAALFPPIRVSKKETSADTVDQADDADQPEPQPAIEPLQTTDYVPPITEAEPVRHTVYDLLAGAEKPWGDGELDDTTSTEKVDAVTDRREPEVGPDKVGEEILQEPVIEQDGEDAADRISADIARERRHTAMRKAALYADDSKKGLAAKTKPLVFNERRSDTDADGPALMLFQLYIADTTQSEGAAVSINGWEEPTPSDGNDVTTNDKPKSWEEVGSTDLLEPMDPDRINDFVREQNDRTKEKQDGLFADYLEADLRHGIAKDNVTRLINNPDSAAPVEELEDALRERLEAAKALRVALEIAFPHVKNSSEVSDTASLQPATDNDSEPDKEILDGTETHKVVDAAVGYEQDEESIERYEDAIAAWRAGDELFDEKYDAEEAAATRYGQAIREAAEPGDANLTWAIRDFNDASQILESVMKLLTLDEDAEHDADVARLEFLSPDQANDLLRVMYNRSADKQDELYKTYLAAYERHAFANAVFDNLLDEEPTDAQLDDALKERDAAGIELSDALAAYYPAFGSSEAEPFSDVVEEKEPTSSEAHIFVAGMDRAAINRATINLGPSERVQFWSTFQSTADIPFPSAATRRTVDDISAVIAGSKPAAMFIPEDLTDPLLVSLITEQQDRLESLAGSEAVDYYGGIKYFLGREENVRTLAELYQGRGGNDSPLPNDEVFHRAVGEALGYPAAAIDSFIDHIYSTSDEVTVHDIELVDRERAVGSIAEDDPDIGARRIGDLVLGPGWFVRNMPLSHDRADEFEDGDEPDLNIAEDGSDEEDASSIMNGPFAGGNFVRETVSGKKMQETHENILRRERLQVEAEALDDANKQEPTVIADAVKDGEDTSRYRDEVAPGLDEVDEDEDEAEGSSAEDGSDEEDASSIMNGPFKGGNFVNNLTSPYTSSQHRRDGNRRHAAQQRKERERRKNQRGLEGTEEPDETDSDKRE